MEWCPELPEGMREPLPMTPEKTYAIVVGINLTGFPSQISMGPVKMRLNL